MSIEKTPLSTEDAIKLLDLLCADDAFRNAFAADPAAAMQQISPEAGYSSGDCAPVETLAEKEEFKRARDVLIQHLAAVPAFRNPHCFVLGQIDTAVQRKPSL